VAKVKPKADQRADTRGGKWVGIPHAVIDSVSYRTLSLWARAALIEIVRRFNGYNNSRIVCSQRELAEALSTTNFRKIGAAIAELMEHGLVDVAAEGKWKERQAREYRLTFVSTGDTGTFRPATNDYQAWLPSTSRKSGVDDVSAESPLSADASSAMASFVADDVSARIAQHRQKAAIEAAGAADDVSSLIVKPYPPVKLGRGIGENTATESPISAAADFSRNSINRLNLQSRRKVA
jgi:hypothetical protein